jgi:hypothetical protein
LIQTQVQKLRDGNYETVRLVEDLRHRCSDSEFGYRMQAIFAHVLMRQCWSILEIKAKGHPDIRAAMGGHEVFVQVKSVSHSSANSTIELSSDDAAGIRAMGQQHEGWFAVLDCATPIQWIVIEGGRAARLLGTPHHLATLHANRDVVLSKRCNEAFLEIISEHRQRLPNLRYAVLCSRALADNGL